MLPCIKKKHNPNRVMLTWNSAPAHETQNYLKNESTLFVPKEVWPSS